MINNWIAKGVLSMKVVSMLGVTLDMGKYIAENEEMVALGNANMNARGDIVDKNGNVIKKREDIAAEYYNNNPNAVRQVGVKNLEKEVFKTPAEMVKELQAQQQAETPSAPAASPKPAAKKRKIVDSE
jgi:hypothetical protein